MVKAVKNDNWNQEENFYEYFGGRGGGIDGGSAGIHAHPIGIVVCIYVFLYDTSTAKGDKEKKPDAGGFSGRRYDTYHKRIL